eukprot:4347849-Amphidinium_carterae.1
MAEEYAPNGQKRQAGRGTSLFKPLSRESMPTTVLEPPCEDIRCGTDQMGGNNLLRSSLRGTWDFAACIFSKLTLFRGTASVGTH